MGVTVHFRFAAWSKGAVEEALDRAEAMARQFARGAERVGELSLLVDPAEGCETLSLSFRRWEEVRRGAEKGVWRYEHRTLNGAFNLDGRERSEGTPYGGLWVCSGSCKTGGVWSHILVSELLRLLASRCSMVEVRDEGGYYETRDLRRVAEALEGDARRIGELLRRAGWRVEGGRWVRPE